MKTIAENTYDFERLRKSGAVYVDKTGMLHDLIADPGRQLYFISRPRRFGKSLMISTLRAIFDGRRDLFDGLAIAKKENFDWHKYSVLQFDFSGVKTGSIEEFKEDFAAKVSDVIREAGLKYDKKAFPGRNFANAIKALRGKSKEGIVLLIDEYDAPIEHAIDNYELANAIRAELSNFYIQIKENESCIRFMMMTGVTQFAKMSVFSALSNLSDISLDVEAATLLGYTEEELHFYFDEHMRAHASVMGLSLDAYMNRLRIRCNGYLFSGKVKTFGEEFNTPEEKQKVIEEKLKAIKVYNPVAVGINLAKRNVVFESSWAATGTASVMMNYISNHELSSMDYENVPNIRESRLNSCNLKELPAITVLYQSGYLTIKNYDPALGFYTLGVPNEEVREDLSRLIIYSQKGEVEGEELFSNIAAALVHANFDEVQKLLRVLYSRLTCGPKEDTTHEAPYQRILQVVLSAGGFHVQPEVQQSAGRADVVALHQCGNFVFELKVDKPVTLALDQIRERDYTQPYQIGEIPLYAVALTFDSKKRNVKDMQAVRVK